MSSHSIHPIHLLNVTESAQLLLTPCPDSDSSALSAALQQFSFNNSPALLTMMTKQELQDKGLAELGKHATISDLQWFHMPIEEGGIPDQAWEDYWQIMQPRFLQLLKSGVNLTLHSKKNTGRTAIVAARIMLGLGFSLDEIVSKVEAIMPDAFNTLVQLQYIQSVAAKSK